MLKKQNNSLFASDGFTLTETMAYILIFVFFIMAAANFVIYGFRATSFGFEQDSAVQQARQVVNSFIKEIRDAYQAETGEYLLDEVNPQELSFYCDYDYDGRIEKIRYFLDGTILKKGVIEPTGDPVEYNPANETVTEIARYVNNQTEAVFTYYDTDNNLIADPPGHKTAIRLIHMSLKINVTPEKAPNDYYVTTDVQIRNLKDNL